MSIRTFIFLLIPVLTAAAGPAAAQPAEARPFERPVWQRAIRGLDYGPAADEQQPRETQPRRLQPAGGQEERSPRRLFPFSGGGPWLTTLLKVAVLLGGALLLFLLLRGLLGLELAPRNRRVPPPEAEPFDLERIEEDPHAHDLAALIERARAAGRYDLAVRLYYLDTLKMLSGRQLIHWKKDKTNRDYLRELRGASLRPAFEGLTQAFERAWYGGHILSAQAFQRLETRFLDFRRTAEGPAAAGHTGT